MNKQTYSTNGMNARYESDDYIDRLEWRRTRGSILEPLTRVNGRPYMCLLAFHRFPLSLPW